MGFAVAAAHPGQGARTEVAGCDHILCTKGFEMPRSGSMESSGCEILCKGKFFELYLFIYF